MKAKKAQKEKVEEAVFLALDASEFRHEPLVSTQPVREVTGMAGMTAETHVLQIKAIHKASQVFKQKLLDKSGHSTIAQQPDNDKVSRRAQINQNNDDRRGKHELKHKINHKIVPGHVEKYKPSGGISNYSRENASLRRNCPSELTLKEMHKNLCETSGRQVSMNLYHKTQYLICRVRTREVRSLSKFVSPQTKIWL
ncbi:hypothetical protein RRG08_040424 [Elysia crispata]|uniref:Uncharacterized protein n=1 Tax=Elysia crispata TaxID=231223 RepID=A0AAE0ZDT0_9GAST|nr:hypothetical protein RRG08_040424 [Elysia crispata]